MPKRMGICTHPGCQVLTADGRCPLHRWDTRPSAGRRGYGYEWRKIRDAYIKAHPFCENKLHQGMGIPAVVVDHIKPLVDGGTNAENNLMSLCLSCHAKKTDLQTKRHDGRGI